MIFFVLFIFPEVTELSIVIRSFLDQKKNLSSYVLNSCSRCCSNMFVK